MSNAGSLISIVLPTFNRARFLPRAFEAIRAQEHPNWELIVIDDGSTDETAGIVNRFRASMGDRVKYVAQANQGAYAARNAGLDLCGGKYIAFYDSDDLWLPHHLSCCEAALERHDSLDWVYGACRMVNEVDGTIIEQTTFHPGGRDEAFLRLTTETSGDLRIIRDERALEVAIVEGMYAGLQNSVFRSQVFQRLRFRTTYGERKLSPVASSQSAEDQLLVARALAEGFTIGYFDCVHVEYRVHESNSSAAGSGSDYRKIAEVYRTLIAGFEALRSDLPASAAVHAALKSRLSREYFWHLGYGALWPAGLYSQALKAYLSGLLLRPYDLRLWKTYVAARIRSIVRHG